MKSNIIFKAMNEALLDGHVVTLSSGAVKLYHDTQDVLDDLIPDRLVAPMGVAEGYYIVLRSDCEAHMIIDEYIRKLTTETYIDAVAMSTCGNYSLIIALD